MNFEIKHRFTSAVIFSCELNAEVAGAAYSIRLGFAVKAAVRARANLADADLADANLAGADLADANLARADLADADLADADRVFKADLWMTLTQNPHEVPALVSALRDGRVNGSVYEGDCACLLGTIAKARGVSYEDIDHSARNPAERWFMMISTGDTPDKETSGGFAAKKALEWTLEWCALNGVEVAA